MIPRISLTLCCILFIAGCSKVDNNHLGKIVSINPCTDAILLELADRDQIGAISHYSHDEKSSSSNIELAKTIPSTGHSAEEIIALKPSLVLAGGHVSNATLQALQTLNIAVRQYPVANSISESHAQIKSIAQAIGQEKRGRNLIAEIDNVLFAAKPMDNEAIPAIVWQGGGLVAGNGTLIGDIMAHTGFKNSAKKYGLAQWDIIGLERLSAKPPAIILRDGNNTDRILQHPILENIDSEVTDFSQSMIWCAGPTISKAAAQLAQIRKDYRKSAP